MAKTMARHTDKVEVARRYISDLKWKENEEMTDAVLEMTIRHPDRNDGIGTWFNLNRDEVMELVRRVTPFFSDTFSIDAMGYSSDGDDSKETIRISADIHLAE